MSAASINTEDVLKYAAKAGYSAFQLAKNDREAAFQAAFLKSVNELGFQNGERYVWGEALTTVQETQTGADIVLYWGPSSGRKVCYLQIKVLYEDYGAYCRAVKLPEQDIEPFWSTVAPFFDAQYRSTAEGPYYGRYQGVRLIATVFEETRKLALKMPPVPSPHLISAGYLVVGQDGVLAIPITGFSAAGDLTPTVPIEISKYSENRVEYILNHLTPSGFSKLWETSRVAINAIVYWAASATYDLE